MIMFLVMKLYFVAEIVKLSSRERTEWFLWVRKRELRFLDAADCPCARTCMHAFVCPVYACVPYMRVHAHVLTGTCIHVHMYELIGL